MNTPDIMAYVDRYDRFHTKRIDSDSDGLPTNNAYIYSFYAMMLGIYDEVPGMFPDLPRYEELLGFHRHPDGCSVPISHDEYVGVAGMSEGHAKQISLLGQTVCYWQFCDLPDFEPKPFYKLNPLRVIRDFYYLSKEKDDKGRNNSRKATVKYPYIWSICFWHRTPHQYFYLRCAQMRPSIWTTLGFIGASVFSILFSDKQIMLGFKLMKLKQAGYTLPEKLIAKLFKNKVDMFPQILNECNGNTECPLVRKAAHLGDALNDKI